MPFSIVELYVLALGISLLLGAINVKFRDIGSIWEVLMQAMFYAVPIIYPISLVMNTSVPVAKILLINPIAQVIQDVRENLITGETITTWELAGPVWGFISVAIVIAIFVFSVFYFRKKSKYFAEEV